MSDAALHLVERVLPAVPIRQWVCSLPWQLRTLLGYDRQLCSAVMAAFVKELSGSYQRRAKRLLGLASVDDAHTGAVTFIQRFDSALRLNVHAHTLILDGVYVRNACCGELQFESLPAPSVDEVGDVARRTAERVQALLSRSGRFRDVERAADEALDLLSADQPVLASCYQAAASGRELLGPRAGQPTLQRVGHGQAAARTGSRPDCALRFTA